MGIENHEFLFQVIPSVNRILQKPHTPIPAQDCVVVSRWTEPLGLCKVLQSLLE